MKIQTNVLFAVAILLQISSYFMPFLRQRAGWQFFEEGLKALFEGGLWSSQWHLFYAFFRLFLVCLFC